MPYIGYGPAPMAAQGWCPSTYRIHDAPDGGIARVRVPGGGVGLDALRVIAEVARRHGNGLIEVTSRANLQIRGVDPRDGHALRADLAPTGLIAPSAAIEDRRNVLASPTAGIAGDELLDVRSLVPPVVDALDALPDHTSLTAKFGVLLDGGGSPSLHDVPMDLALGARRAVDGGVVLAVGLGSTLQTALASDSHPALTIDADDVPALVRAAASVCATPTDGGRSSRMADVVERLGRVRVVEVLATHVRFDEAALLDELVEPSTGPVRWVEVLGRDRPMTADHLDALADGVAAIDGDEVRLTPWRSVIVPTGGQSTAEVLAELATRGWTSAPPAPVWDAMPSRSERVPA